MKITIYTISDCYFSKQEKEYLQSHNLPFEERNLEENREFLTEMLTISNNFAGTPVTKIEKDDGQIVVLKGFTKEEFDKTFGVTDTQTPQVVVSASTPAVTAAPVVPTPPVVDVQPVAPPTPAPTAPSVDMGSIAAQIEQLKKLQESLAAQTQTPAVSAAPVAHAVPAYQAAQPQQPVAPPLPVVETQPVSPVAAPAAQPSNVDDSLAAILAELQTKINSSQPGGTTGTSPTSNS